MQKILSHLLNMFLFLPFFCVVSCVHGAPQRTFRGAYMSYGAGFFYDFGMWETEGANSITLESGSMGYTLKPVGLLPTITSYRIRGQFQVLHDLHGKNASEHTFSSLGFMVDGSVGYSVFVDSIVLSGVEVRLGYFGGGESYSVSSLPSTQKAIFNNDGGRNPKQFYYYTMLYGAELAADQRGGLVQQVDNKGRPTTVLIKNDFSLVRETSPAFFINPMIYGAILPGKNILVGVKGGVAFCQWNVSWGFSGEYGSSAYFVDNFAGNPPTVAPQQVTWTWEDEQTHGPVMMPAYSFSQKESFWNVGVVIAPYMEIKVTPILSVFMEVNAFMWGREFQSDFSLMMDTGDMVEFHDSFYPDCTIAGNIGIKFYFDG